MTDAARWSERPAGFSMNLLIFLDRFPPKLCRFVATDRSGHRPLTTREIAKRGGLSTGRVSELSLKNTWRGVQVETVQAFAHGCGVDLFRLSQKNRFLKRSQWVHIKKREAYFKRLIG